VHPEKFLRIGPGRGQQRKMTREHGKDGKEQGDERAKVRGGGIALKAGETNLSLMRQ